MLLLHIVVRAPASQLGGHGFKPKSGHTKELKINVHCLLIYHLICKNEVNKLSTRSYQWIEPPPVAVRASADVWPTATERRRAPS